MKLRWIFPVILLLSGCRTASIDNQSTKIEPTVAQRPTDSGPEITNPAPVSAAATSTEATSIPSESAVKTLPNLGPAPELNNEVWLNVDQPLRLSDLRGKVVLLDIVGSRNNWWEIE